jgi:hypothetical protein
MVVLVARIVVEAAHVLDGVMVVVAVIHAAQIVIPVALVIVTLFV